MRYLKLNLITFTLLFGLLSCTNSNDAADTESVTPVDTAVAKTIIVDVRTVEEWADDGHAECSVNYPLAELDKKIASLKEYNKIIIVCRSGSRAGVAKEMLEQAGFKNVENKGAWQNIICK
jgi:rhodanese-related sulfurtransferase